MQNSSVKIVYIDAIADANIATSLRSAGVQHVLSYNAPSTSLTAAHFSSSFFSALRCTSAVVEAYAFAMQVVSAHMTGKFSCCCLACQGCRVQHVLLAFYSLLAYRLLKHSRRRHFAWYTWLCHSKRCTLLLPRVSGRGVHSTRRAIPGVRFSAGAARQRQHSAPAATGRRSVQRPERSGPWLVGRTPACPAC